MPLIPPPPPAPPGHCGRCGRKRPGNGPACLHCDPDFRLPTADDVVDVLVAVCLAQRGEHPGPIRLNLHDQPCCADVASRLRALGVDVDGGWQSLCLDNSPPVWRGDDEAFVQGAPVWPAPPGVRPHIREYGYVVRRTPGGWRVVEQRTLLMT